MKKINELTTNVSAGEHLPVMEHFYTIQGEGFHSGKAAYFVRLGGCSVGCHWCDVKESWDASKHPTMDVESIVEQVVKTPAKILVITGGEPLEHPLDKLTLLAKQHNLQTHLETSGSSPLSGQWDWICLSPKKFKPPLDEVIKAANELKIVIYNHHDFKWAEHYANKVKNGTKLFLQPEWSVREKVMPLIVAYVLQNPQWQICLQIHKYLNIP